MSTRTPDPWFRPAVISEMIEARHLYDDEEPTDG